MKHSDFRIGLEFIAAAGFHWRCTDIGTRTILAIPLDQENPDWYQGPPYIVREQVFDEAEMLRCYLTVDEAIADAAQECEAGGHPGYPSEDMWRMLEAGLGDEMPGLLRFDRCRADGELLHPFATREDDGTRVVDVYLPFCRTFDAMPVDAFIALPRATPQDVRRLAAVKRADRS